MAAPRSPLRKLGLASTIWMACAIALLLASAMLLWKLVFGADYREQALADVQRIEFDIAYQGGNAIPQNLTGETLTLETALAMADAASAPPPALPDEIPVEEVTPEEMVVKQDLPSPLPENDTQPADQPDNPEAPENPPLPQMIDTPEPPAQPDAPAEEAMPEEALPDEDNTPKLAPTEQMTDKGIIPAIAEDGTMPWQAFAKEAPATGDRPRIAVIVSGLGLAQLSTQSAIALPDTITLAFSPYGREATARMAEEARADGHEIMLDLPMQTDLYPAVDPGPYGIRADLGASVNHERLLTVLSKARGYVGLLGPSRDAISLDRNLTAPLVDGIAGQGLLFVSGYSEEPEGMFRVARQAAIPVLYTDVELDNRISEGYIRTQLARAEDIARSRGHALVVGHAYPITLELLEIWIRELESKGFVLVPVSALGERQ